MVIDELSAYLNALDRDANYRVVKTLKSSPIEVTEQVCFPGANRSELGPFIRKKIKLDSGMGKAYQEIWQAQCLGMRFRHLPHIESCYENGNELVVVMEYVRGETLRETVHRLGASVALAAEVFPRLCDAVIELHEEFNPPIIHRDLKPTNVLISAHELTLIDFGIARRFRKDAESDTSYFGTRAYAPPEQFGFGQTDMRSDVYSLGMMLYYLLIGREPTPSLAGGPFEEPTIPPSLRLVLSRATSFDPNSRYQSVRELREAYLLALTSCLDTDSPLPHAEKLNQHNARTPNTSNSEQPIKISEVFGLVWDGVLLACWALLAVACTSLTVNPTPYFSQFPFWFVALVFFGVLLLFASGITYIVLDKRWLRRKIPILQSQTFRRSLVIGLIMMGIALIVLSVSAAVFAFCFPDIIPASEFS